MKLKVKKIKVSHKIDLRDKLKECILFNNLTLSEFEEIAGVKRLTQVSQRKNYVVETLIPHFKKLGIKEIEINLLK